MSTTQNYRKKIADKLAYLESMIKRYGDMSLYEENLAMEDVICNLLNLAYGYELENLNKKVANYPAVDLGDVKRGIAVQVTSNNGRDKIESTLKTFDRNELGAVYHRVIIFVLGSRKKFQKAFPCQGAVFLPERDLMDFGTLLKRIEMCELDTLMAIYDYLEQEYPGVSRDIKWMKWIGVVLGALLLTLILWNVATYLYEEYREDHPKYAYEINMNSLNLDEAAYILGSKTKSCATIYTEKPVQDAFYFGTMLTVLYNNLDEQDRTITNFSIYAENIVEDTAPYLQCTDRTEYMTAQLELYNYGWGETGDIQISFIGIEPFDSPFPDPIALREDAPDFWMLESLQPGEKRTVQLLTEEDFVLDPTNPIAGYMEYDLVFELYAPEMNYRQTLECTLNELKFPLLAAAPPDGLDTTYIVWAETANSEWECTHPIQSTVPGKKMALFPIFIVPEKTCTMTVRIRFETHDGETIDIIALEDTKFIIPYYPDKSEYIEEMILDWSRVCGKIVVFPNDSAPYILEKE